MKRVPVMPWLAHRTHRIAERWAAVRVWDGLIAGGLLGGKYENVSARPRNGGFVALSGR
jgi:hypothetical protein